MFVCAIRPLQEREVGLLLWARRVGDIDSCTASATAARRPAANAGSVTFRADVRKLITD